MLRFIFHVKIISVVSSTFNSVINNVQIAGIHFASLKWVVSSFLFKKVKYCLKRQKYSL